MTMRAIAAALLGLLLLSCAPEEDVPFETVFVRVDVRDPFGSRPPGPLKVGLLWATTSTVFGSTQVDLPEDGNTVDLPLAFPIPRPLNLPFFEFRLTRESVIIHIPRVVVFQDADESGDFTPWTTSGPITDPIFAINGRDATVVTAVRDLEAELVDLTATDVNTFYELTNGANTPFIIFPGRTSTLTPNRVAFSERPVVSMYFEDSDEPARDVGCIESRQFQPEAQLQPISATGTSSRSVSILVDTSLDADAICGLTTPNCLSVDANTVTATVPDDVQTAGRRSFARCRTGGSLQSLVTFEAELRCEGCDCGWVERSRAIVVQTSSTPPDWPCGDTVPFCVSTLPLFQIDEACLIEE